eukprot:14086698-Alexandrium_andersonii.AAC.1
MTSERSQCCAKHALASAPPLRRIRVAACVLQNNSNALGLNGIIPNASMLHATLKKPYTAEHLTPRISRRTILRPRDCAATLRHGIRIIAWHTLDEVLAPLREDLHFQAIREELRE